MKNLILMLLLFLGSTVVIYAQGIVGKWKTIDDKTGKEKSIIEIYEEDGIYSGKILELLNPSKPNPTCEKCPGSDKGQPVEGLVIIKDMKVKDEGLSGGKILDPESGKVYKCTIKLNGKDKLDVRGFVGISLLGRTQTWIRE